jgi:YHS domain-containing protein
MFRHTSWVISRRSTILGRFRHPLLAVCAVACSALTWAAEQPPSGPWHADLARARAAAASSQRPVLAVFIASWSPESRQTAATIQANPEVAALMAACFEPVVLDVDVEAELARRLEIVHVPTAVVLDLGDERLAAFECPATVPAFIAAAAQAGRDATTRRVTADDSGPLTEAARSAPAGRGSISMLTTKVRHLSSFAGGPPVAAEPAAPRPLDLHDSFAGGQPAASQEPALPQAPPVWNAEKTAAPLAVEAPQERPRPVIEPPAEAPVAPPWLSAAAPATGESSASVSDMPAARPPVTPPQPAGPTASFWSGIRNPFARTTKPDAAAVKPAPPATMPPARPQWPGLIAAAPPAAPASTSAPAGEEPMPLGLEGYCPVTLAEKQAWAEGRPQYGARHRGRTYLFAGPEQQRTFLADPDRYAPALSGDDPVLVFEQGRSMQGQRRYGVVCQSRMYLFTSPETRDTFAANPEKYAARVALAEQSATRTY